MIAVGVLTASIFLQLVAAGLALRLIRVTGWRFAWSFVSAALVLMSLRRCITLYRALIGEGTLSPDLSAELVALTISVLMVTGVALIGPLFARAKRVEQDLRRSEAEVQRLNAELTNRVEERTTELHATRQALVRNQSLAALGEMTGSVAHDLRNPLGAIATSFDVIQCKCEAAKVDVDRALGRVQRTIFWTSPVPRASTRSRRCSMSGSRRLSRNSPCRAASRSIANCGPAAPPSPSTASRSAVPWSTWWKTLSRR
jgi:signal transduction histidine kinase